MTDSSIRVQNTPQRIDTMQVSTDVGAVERQVCVIGDPTVADGLVTVGPSPKATALPVTLATDERTLSVKEADGRTSNVFSPGSVVTTTVTANQVIAAYTVPVGKVFMLQGWDAAVRLTGGTNTHTAFGEASLRIAAVNVMTRQEVGAGFAVTEVSREARPIPVTAGSVVQVVCTPGATTSYTWRANLQGYEVDA